ncbi:SDR family oxidoreductase [Vagococcus salmoninarum]|uniref:SDR family oxidoreductase n=1 Tax=Vagococcus salmoninarum TaxID=2739 RepID=UPI001881F7B4|nr:SDR family oxidoreductase [Vagococcus salmoninarum]MBE9387812.1 SDR family oxidoreductase [Vagococcus salmoninarum]
MGYTDLVFPKESVFLITGGAGFIGSNLSEVILKKGYKVKCLDDFSSGKRKNIEAFLEHPNYELIEGDITDIDTCMKACQGVDYVSNQAAWGSVPRSIAMPLKYEEINIKGTLNMLEAAKEQKVKKFVYASSSSVYGDDPTLPKVEGVEGNILSPYALTKKTNEEYAKLYSSLYGLETVGMRYFNVFGRRQDPEGSYAAVIPKFVKSLLTNEAPIINGNGKQSRDFTYIENVIEANLRAMKSGSEVTGEIFNIAYGGQIELLEVYTVLESLIGIQLTPIFGPDRLGDIKHSNADITKAKQMLGYAPDYSFEKGIREAVDWYQENL